MAKNEFNKLLNLFKRYLYILCFGVFVIAICLSISFHLYDEYAGKTDETYWFKVADFLKGIAQTILSTVLIGGVLGGVFNFIVEEQKKEDKAVKKRLKQMQESRDQRKAFRQEIRRRLQGVHDDVELARVLIKSHRSGLTYGEQIRTRIMPGNIVLQDIKRQLQEIEDESPILYLSELRVSLTFMSAYLSVLIEEFAQQYLDIANLQKYQDTLAERRRDIYSELLANTEKINNARDPQRAFVENTNSLFQNDPVPDRMKVVWDAMGNLDYIWDFIDDLRNHEGSASKYQTFFLDHYFHCFRLLRDKESQLNKNICDEQNFETYLQKLESLTNKKNDSDQPITKNDSLTRMIMIEQLHFDFEAMKRKE